MNFIQPEYIVQIPSESSSQFFCSDRNHIWNTHTDHYNIIIHSMYCINSVFLVDLHEFNKQIELKIIESNIYKSDNIKIDGKTVYLDNKTIMVIEGCAIYLNNDLKYKIFTYEEYIIKSLLE